MNSLSRFHCEFERRIKNFAAWVCDIAEILHPPSGGLKVISAEGFVARRKVNNNYPSSLNKIPLLATFQQ